LGQSVKSGFTANHGKEKAADASSAGAGLT
jgi:hypothetical protein